MLIYSPKIFIPHEAAFIHSFIIFIEYEHIFSSSHQLKIVVFVFKINFWAGVDESELQMRKLVVCEESETEFLERREKRRGGRG